MKKIFEWLLLKYCKNEAGRIIIYKKLHEATSNDYSEQTYPGNLYNAAIEFIKASKIKDKELVRNLMNDAVTDLNLN